MANRAAAILAQAVRPARADLAAACDRDLLRRFADDDDQPAFAAVVGRHTAMVLGVCTRLLPSREDAEDACQAVFLILAKKAGGGCRWQPSVANWLYVTARKVAANARIAAARRTRREGAAAVPGVAKPASALDQMTGREAIAALDEELDRLSAIYREPLVLCYLEGLTRDEAATRLGVPEATLKSRLERGRKRLADALTARGCALGVALLATAATSTAGASPSRLVGSILAAIGGRPSDFAAALAQGVAVNGVLTNAKLAVLLAGMVVTGFVSAPIGQGPAAYADEKPAMKAEKKPDAPKDDKPKTDVKGRTITGTVLDSAGKPIPAELMLVWQEGKPQPLGKAKEDGSFKVTVPMTHGEHDYGGWLVAKAPGHGFDFQPHGMEYIPASMTAADDVALKLPKERPVGGRVIDQQGKPVAGVKVVASRFSAFDSDESMAGHFKGWATESYQQGSPPGGDRGMWFADGYRNRTTDDGRSPYSATTDTDGRFAIAGIGANQLVNLRIRGDGVADKELVALNRDGFDPAPVNKAAKDNEPKGYSFGGKWQLYGADPTVVVEPEKVVRGRVTDQDGKPRAGVTVAFSRTNKRDLNPDYNTAVTDEDGKYEIRGARKHKGYGVEVSPDPAAGLLPCQAFADDTVGYEPITLDIKQAKGIVVSGRVTNRATGKPVFSHLHVDVMANNPFVEKYPPFMHSASSASNANQTDKDGHFRVVVIPGRVLLAAAPWRGDRGEFKPAVRDPKHADSFFPSEGALMYAAYGGRRGFVQGNWCQVVEAKPEDTALTVNVEFEPATKTLVKVADADGKPVTGVKATGLEVREFAGAKEIVGDTLTVFNVEAKKERLVAVRHEGRNLVGTLKLTAETKDPVLTLGAAGTLTGRAVDANGKPITGLDVHVRYGNRPVQEAAGGIRTTTTTDANGEFRVDGVFPGQEFQVFYHKGRMRFGPDYELAPKRALARHGDTLKLGDLKLEPNTDEE